MLKRLYELRKEKRITQQRLAVELGIDQASISSYESGKYLPTLEVLIKLADYFSTSTDYLLGRSNVKTSLDYPLDQRTLSMLTLFSTLPPCYQERVIGYIDALQFKANGEFI